MATFTNPAILCLIIFISCASVPCFATVYTVGDSAGWALGVDYDTWASSKTFAVGDSLSKLYNQLFHIILNNKYHKIYIKKKWKKSYIIIIYGIFLFVEFNYPSGHSVDEVSGSDYTTCTVGNAITSDNTGSTTVTLKAAGTHYFVCGVIGHCGGGMKLSVKVTESSSSATTPASPATGGGSTTDSPSTTVNSPAIPAGTTTMTPPAATTNTETMPSSSATISPYTAVFVAGISVIYSLVILS